MKDFNEFLKEKFKEEDFSREYYHQATFYRLADQFLLMRKKRGLTQKELAEKVGTTQAVISRLENVSVKPSLETIVKIAKALDAVVEVNIKPREEIQPFADENQIVIENLDFKNGPRMKVSEIALFGQSKMGTKELFFSDSNEYKWAFSIAKPAQTRIKNQNIKKQTEYA